MLNLVNPLLDLLESAPASDVEDEDGDCGPVDVVVDVLVVAFLALHVEVHDLVHSLVVNVKGRLDVSEPTFVWISVDCSFSTTLPRFWQIAAVNPLTFQEA